jgi:hypothetical protein
MTALTKKSLDKPQKVKTTLDELEVLSRLKVSVEWSILKRIMKRYIENLKSISFNLTYFSPDHKLVDPAEFMIRHRDTTAQARAFKSLVKIVENADKKMEEEEK